LRSEWQAMLADAVVETHDRIVGRLYRASERICQAKVADEANAVRDTLKSFAESAAPWSMHRMMASRWRPSSRVGQGGTASKPLLQWQPG
jgi:hypothetical protein